MKFDEIMQKFENLSEEANKINPKKLSIDRQFYAAGIIDTWMAAAELEPDDFNEANLVKFSTWVDNCRDNIMKDMGFIIENQSSENWADTDLSRHARISAGGNWFYDFIKVYGKYVYGFFEDLSGQNRIPAFNYLDQLPEFCKEAKVLNLD